jgi:hypothetical protein
VADAEPDAMDSAYDAKEIKQASRDLGHVPIIDPNRRPANSVPLSRRRQFGSGSGPQPSGATAA